MADIEVHDDGEMSLVGGDNPGHALMRLRPLPARTHEDDRAPSTAFLAELRALCEAAPAMRGVFERAAETGDALAVVFPPEVVTGLRNGTLRLMNSSKAVRPIAVNSTTAQVVSHGTVVGGAAGASAGAGAIAVAGGAATVTGGATIASVAVVALPVLIASAAAYAQQRKLALSLASISDVVERIEARLEDTDTGVCEAAEQFIALVEDAVAEGGLTDYLRLELASQRTAVEALYIARRTWVQRFKKRLEDEQIEREKSKGRGQPWVDAVIKETNDGKLEQELTLFVRSLLSRTKLNVIVAAALAEEHRGASAMRLIDRTERELRSEFFDLYRRLSPLARIEPEASVLQKLPGRGAALRSAHQTVRLLVEHLDRHVLHTIPDPDHQSDVQVVLSPRTVAAIDSHLRLVS